MIARVKDIPTVNSLGELLIHQLVHSICYISTSGLTKSEQFLLEKYAKTYKAGFDGDFVAPFLKQLSEAFPKDVVRKREQELYAGTSIHDQDGTHRS